LVENCISTHPRSPLVIGRQGEGVLSFRIRQNHLRGVEYSNLWNGRKPDWKRLGLWSQWQTPSKMTPAKLRLARCHGLAGDRRQHRQKMPILTPLAFRSHDETVNFLPEPSPLAKL
jgi:hypothetical protein